MENVKKFYDALTTNEALKAKAAKLNEKHAGTKPDEAALAKEIIAFAAAEGYSFTQEELTAYGESMKKSRQAVSDDELEAVAGGNASGTCEKWDLCFCAIGGGGKHKGPNITCVCIFLGNGEPCGCKPSSELVCPLAGHFINMK